MCFALIQIIILHKPNCSCNVPIPDNITSAFVVELNVQIKSHNTFFVCDVILEWSRDVETFKWLMQPQCVAELDSAYLRDYCCIDLRVSVINLIS